MCQLRIPEGQPGLVLRVGEGTNPPTTPCAKSVISERKLGAQCKISSAIDSLQTPKTVVCCYQAVGITKDNK